MHGQSQSQSLPLLVADGLSGSIHQITPTTLLIDVGLRTAAILFVTAVAAWWIRKRSAAAIHRVWTLGFAGCLAVPLITLVAPSWTLPLLPASSEATEVSTTVSPSYGTGSDEAGGHPAGTFNPASEIGSHAASYESFTIPHQNWTRPTEAAEKTLSQSPEMGKPREAELSNGGQTQQPTQIVTWQSGVLFIWIVGVLFALVRVSCQHLLLYRLLQNCEPVGERSWGDSVDEVRQLLKIARPVRILRAISASSPIAAGVVRPTVVLPNDSADWNASHRRLVLLHELAHVKRMDVLSQMAAGLVSAICWFNPLCWYGQRRMRSLRELACDDLVLATGERATEYADVLLDVARTFRHKELVAAVGMARNSNVDDRILAILDHARTRVGLTRRAARGLLIASVVVLATIGSLRLSSSGEPTTANVAAASQPNTQTSGTTEQNESNGDSERGTDNGDINATRTMEIRVVGESGQPLENARIHVGAWYVEGFTGDKPPKDHVTDRDGVLSLRIPQRLQILRLWASKAGHVPEFVNFARGTHDGGRLIPRKFEFRLATGATLSGRVVDDEGAPLAGVQVDVQVHVTSPPWTVNPTPTISTWLTDHDYTDSAPVTDETGLWSIGIAPKVRAKGERNSLRSFLSGAAANGGDYRFSLRFTHENYVSDSRWGELQEQQEITTEQLRDGSARLVMERGVPLKGTVRDSTGQRVTSGLVIWHDDPYHGPAVHESQIGATGRFETLPLAPGKYPLTIVAPGAQPHRRQITVSKGMDDLQVSLIPGKRLTLEIVDQSFNPVPNAYVTVGEWQGANALFNHDHPNVPDSQIPRRANDKGFYVWDWAPDDLVTYRVSAKNYSTAEITVVARDQPHVVKLPKQLIFSGQVTDSVDGQPVKQFRATPVTVFRPDFYSTPFREQVPGRDGSYRLEVEGFGEMDYRYKVRVDANGYRSALSVEDYGLTDGALSISFSLDRAPARRGRIVDSSGQPASSATVIPGTPTAVPIVTNSKLDWTGRPITAAADGTFESAATFEPVRFRVVHDSGWAEVLRQPDEPIGTIKLQPWAKVSGTLLQEGRPVPNQTIYFQPIATRPLGEARFQDSYFAQTDEAGRFEFARLPAISGSLRANLGPWRDSPLTSSQAIPLDLKPGDERNITLGGEGATVTGRILATGRGDAELNRNWSINHLIRRDGGIGLSEISSPLSFDPTGPVQASWFLDPSYTAWLNTQPNYFVKLSPDGRFHIGGVPAGKYDLVLQLYEEPAGCLVETVGEKVVSIEITPSDVALRAKDVGRIEVECRAGPRRGEDMRAYRFMDANGRERTIDEMKGRYVVMYVWASWCAPCLEHMPDIQATTERLAGEPVTFVALNIDEEKEKARSLVERHEWSWSQNYLGDNSAMSRQLAVSSVPTYFLINQEGKFESSFVKWSDMAATVNERLGLGAE